MNNVEFNKLPKNLEEALLDAAFDVAAAFRAFQRANPKNRWDEEQALYAAAHVVEKIVKQSVSKASGLLDEQSVQAVIRGQLKSTILVHGPITNISVTSAAKRIGNNIISHLRESSLRDLSNAAAALEVERLRRELADSHELVVSKSKQVLDLVKKLNEVRS